MSEFRPDGVAALLISVVALVVAGYSVWFTRRADIRGEFAHYREERREQPEERERRESKRERRGREAGEAPRRSGRWPRRADRRHRILCFRIDNAGPAIARDIRLWLAQPSAAGAAVSARVRSDAFSRQAKGVVDEAKTRASELQRTTSCRACARRRPRRRRPPVEPERRWTAPGLELSEDEHVAEDEGRLALRALRRASQRGAAARRERVRLRRDETEGAAKATA